MSSLAYTSLVGLIYRTVKKRRCLCHIPLMFCREHSNICQLQQIICQQQQYTHHRSHDNDSLGRQFITLQPQQFRIKHHTENNLLNSLLRFIAYTKFKDCSTHNSNISISLCIKCAIICKDQQITYSKLHIGITLSELHLHAQLKPVPSHINCS